MAFTRAWNEGVPLGSASAATIDTIIQQLKTDLRERLSGIMPGFSNDAEDPKKLVIAFGPLAQRPSIASVYPGFVYVTSDVGEQFIFICDGANWIQLTFGEPEEVVSGGDGGSSGGGTVVEEFTTSAHSATISLGTTTGSSYTTAPINLGSGIQGGKYPFLSYIKFRNASGPGSWSNVFVNEKGYEWVPGSISAGVYNIPSTNTAAFVGLRYYVDSVTGNLSMIASVRQLGSSAATITVNAVVCYKTVPTPSYSLLNP